MTRQEYKSRQSLPDWMKEFERLSDDFFNLSQYVKQKTQNDQQKEKNHDIKYI